MAGELEPKLRFNRRELLTYACRGAGVAAVVGILGGWLLDGANNREAEDIAKARIPIPEKLSQEKAGLESLNKQVSNLIKADNRPEAQQLIDSEEYQHGEMAVREVDVIVERQQEEAERIDANNPNITDRNPTLAAAEMIAGLSGIGLATLVSGEIDQTRNIENAYEEAKEINRIWPKPLPNDSDDFPFYDAV